MNLAMTREELIITYRPIVYWIVQKINAPQDMYNELIDIGMDTLFSEIDNKIQDKQTNNALQGELYNKIRIKLLSALNNSGHKYSVISQPQQINYTDKEQNWSIDLEDTLLDLATTETADSSPITKKTELIVAKLFGRIRGWKDAVRENLIKAKA